MVGNAVEWTREAARVLNKSFETHDQEQRLQHCINRYGALCDCR